MSNASYGSIREALEAKKAEIEAALADLDRIETLAGLRAPPPPQVNGMSYSQAVFEALSEGPKSRDELCAELGLTSEQVHNAATSHRLRKIVTGVNIDGRPGYALAIHPASTPNLALTEGILQLLRYSKHPMTGGEIAKALEGKVQSSARDFPSTVASTLSVMVRDKRLSHEAGLGYFANEKYPREER